MSGHRDAKLCALVALVVLVVLGCQQGDEIAAADSGGAAGSAEGGLSGGAAGTLGSGGAGAVGGKAGAVGGGTGGAGVGGGGVAGSAGAAACSSGGGGGIAGAVDALGVECPASGPTITIYGNVLGYDYPGGFSVVADVQICLKDCGVPCQWSDQQGEFYLYGVPANSRVILTFAKDGYVPGATAFVTGSEDMNTSDMNAISTQVSVSQQLADAGFDPLYGGNSILYFNTSGAFDGGNYVIQPAALKGPVYLNAEGKNDPSLCGPIGTPGFPGGQAVGGFEVKAGEYLVRAERPNSICAANKGNFPGWPGPSADTIRMPALADTIMSQGWFDCNLP
jgi:hypothetical protein